MIGFETNTTLEKKKFQQWSSAERAKISDPGWGHKYRRALFRAACEYLGISKGKAENLLQIGVHSVLQSSEVHLKGAILEKVKKDPDIILEQNKMITELRKDKDYKTKPLDRSNFFYVQLGGKRSRGSMWKQAFGFWKLHTYSATWEMAFNELTWAVRSVGVNCSYAADVNGNITLQYRFKDILDLRPSWGKRSWEYNAICVVLGFLYHDALGATDELKIIANWKVIVK